MVKPRIFSGFLGKNIVLCNLKGVVMHCKPFFNIYKLLACLPSTYNPLKQFGPRSGPTSVGPDLDPDCFDTDSILFEKKK